MKKLLLILVVALVWAAPASGHLAYKPQGKTLEARQKSQRLNLAHAQYVCINGSNRHKRWSCKAVSWLTRELGETTREIESRTVYHGGYSSICGSACISCESGHDPQVWSPDGKYWGLYQFDYGTWVAHGGLRSEYGRAGAARQHQIAARVRYDAWPNC